ncbi:HlyD family type I secretion periplasmic adaptor subunit [Coralliovum pocilloporae]|uniref:HlyD family type I secretion periplasmic adaptor subunit n=1 Tax=Coralliovum pocilloporae TaxID=3066369 RepID=UPI003306D619
MKKLTQKKAPTGLLRWGFLGLVISGTMVGGSLAWSLTTSIDGAVIAPGLVMVESNRKTIQHLEGGIIRDIRIKEGDLVKEGDTLIVLDDTESSGELLVLRDRLADFKARKARLSAELELASDVSYPQSLLARADEAKIAALIQTQNSLFLSRSAAREAQAALLGKRIDALKAERSSLTKQTASLRKEMALLEEENGVLSKLNKRNLVPISQVLSVRRNIARTDSQIANNDGRFESLAAQILQIKAEKAQMKSGFLETVATELANVQSEIHTLSEREATFIDRQGRKKIIAPKTGRVLNLQYYTVGGVIPPAQAIMDIVPSADALVLTARVPVNDIDLVSAGMDARVRLTAFNRNATPEFSGTVESISADSIVNAEDGTAHYNARISLNKQELQDAKLELVPGMQVETMILTGERLVASYLARPLKDGFSRSFRDE